MNTLLPKTVQHRTGEITLEGTYYIYRISEGAEIVLEDAEELIRIGTEMVGNRQVVSIVDGRNNFSITGEAREYFARQTDKNRFLAVAIITNSTAQRLIINFFIRVNKPGVPTKLFANETEAKKWLQNFL
ncbi:MAG TPA: STAS/SEC14 domain-containing protein [Bacteroidia bacterium]|nr:STAS/SEC14 domain-containing protein [Bacteroidia bacterium]